MTVWTRGEQLQDLLCGAIIDANDEFLQALVKRHGINHKLTRQRIRQLAYHAIKAWEQHFNIVHTSQELQAMMDEIAKRATT